MRQLIASFVMVAMGCALSHSSEAAIRKRKTFRKDADPLAVIFDPEQAIPKPSPLSDTQSLPPSLKGDASQQPLKKVEAAKGSLAPLESIKALLKKEAYLDALATLKMYMAIEQNLKLSEQVRLWLLRAKLEGRVANWSQARSALSFAQALIDAEHSKSKGDSKRLYALAQLKSHAALVEADLKRFSGRR